MKIIPLEVKLQGSSDTEVKAVRKLSMAVSFVGGSSAVGGNKRTPKPVFEPNKKN